MIATRLGLVLLLSIYVRSQLPASCFKNPYIKEREKYPESALQFYDKPLDLQWNSEVRDKCGGEWKKYGICCNPWDLPSHVINNENAIKRATDGMIKFFTESENIAGSLFNLLKQLALSNSHPSHLDWGKNIEFAKRVLENGQNLANFDEFADFPSSQEKEIFKTETTACWAQLNKFRSSSLCQTCSGRSQEFFIDDRGLLTDDLCTQSLKLCLRPLQLTFKLIRFVKWIFEMNEEMLSHAIQLNVHSFADKLKFELAYNEIMKDSKLRQTVEQMTLAKIQKGSASREICNEYFSLAKVPYVQKFM